MLDYLKVLAIYTTSTLLGAISFIPAGIGVTEGTLTGLLTLEGIGVSTALILGIMIRLLTLWYSAFIGFIALIRGRPKNRGIHNKLHLLFKKIAMVFIRINLEITLKMIESIEIIKT